MALGRYQDSLEVLDELKVLAPKESPIFVQKGKIYKKLGEKQKALQAFTMALELDQKDTNMVKTLIEKLHSDDDPNDDNEF
jgi:anaphase-promoting complex subunit 3